MRPWLSCLFFFLAATSAPDVVFVRPPKAVKVSAGQRVETQISVSLAEGYRVQANPASEDYLIPTRLELKPTKSISVEKVTYPPGRPYRLNGADKDLQTYEGDFDIGISLIVSRSTPAGKLILEGQLRYQACNSRACLFPASVPVTVTIAVLPTKAKALLVPRDKR